MGVSFTPQQQKVIDTHGCNLLVSAAAGSGKTAVLVERIVKMVSDETHPMDIDRLLVVTFTNAAAAEMRERISAAIGQKLIKEPENEHLQRQSTLLHNAQITTIDSFCLFIIRNHFHTIGLDPAFRVADEGELKLLKMDVLGSVLEACYQKGEASFLQCMEYFSTGSRDSAVEDAVFKLYDFAMSNPFPEEWLAARKEDYALAESVPEFEGLAWVQELMEETALTLQGIIDQYSQCIALCEEPDGPYMYGELLEEERGKIGKLSAAETYEARYLAFQALSFGRLSSKKDGTVSADKRELVKNTRSAVKEQLQAMQKNYFARPEEEVMQQMRVCREAVCALVDLTLLFAESFAKAKRDKNLLDFDDIEHFALSILIRRVQDGAGNGAVEATETALEYRSYFSEILIDEYQDSNLVQEYLLSAVSGEEQGNYNRFMVGDVKQSIYKFRLARPELFMDKYHTYRVTEGGDTLRIDLHKNFRSRQQVLTSVNAVFSQMMRKELGGIDYDEKAALYPGAAYPENPGSADGSRRTEGENNTELLLFPEIEKGKEEKGSGEELADRIDPKRQEAYGIARRIKELTDSFLVTDKETGELRRTYYKDIVILLRTTAGWDETFKTVLEEEGIPVHVTSRTGYFAAAEIQELLHFLRVLDNPLQDIPFYGVLHACFGSFSEEEIAAVKAQFPKEKYLYDAVTAYAGQEKDEPMPGRLSERLSSFLGEIERYRDMAVYMPVHELLQTIIREYSYLSYVQAKPGGGRRRANVEMLLVKAADYEKTSYYGLYHFLRYIEQLEKYDVDYGEANLQDENADVVRIMSIHKSKGLEFPVCFVSGTAKGFNNRDTNETLVMDVERGIGVDYVNSDLRARSRNLRRNFIALKLRQDNLAEELRILYVAMTRAKEKLILTGVLKKPEKKIPSLMLLQEKKERVLSYDMLSEMGSFLDVLLCAAARNRCFDEIWRLHGIEPASQNPFYGEEMNLKVMMRPWEECLGAGLKEAVVREDERRKLVLFDGTKDIDRMDKHLLTLMSDKFSYEYPYGNLKDLYTKTTVSELKKAGMKEETDFSFTLYEAEPVIPYLPKFIRQDDTVSGTDRGSAFHKVMELFDFKKLTQADDDRKRLEELVKEEMSAMLAAGKLSKVYYDAVSPQKIAVFLKSSVAKRMAKAAERGKLYREQPFVLGLPANRLKESFPADETVLIQGIIDAFFEEDGAYIVVDYKTDTVKTAEELVRRYQTQLDYYAEALEQLSGYTSERLGASSHSAEGMRTAEKIIYSFRLGQEIAVK